MLNRVLDYLVIGSPPQADVANVLRDHAGASQGAEERAGKIFIDEEARHLADRADLLVGKLAGCIRERRKDVLARQSVFLRNLLGVHTGRELRDYQIYRYARALNDRLTKSHARIHDDSRRKLHHLGQLLFGAV